MKITKQILINNHLNNLVEWFDACFPDGFVEYQVLLDTLVNEGYYQDADWVLRSIGPDNETVFEADVLTGETRFFAGSVIVKSEITLTGLLHAAGDIIAGGDVDVVGGIYAGGDLKSPGCVYSRTYVVVGGSIIADEIVAGEHIKAGGDIIVNRDMRALEGIKAVRIKVGGHLSARAIYSVDSVDVEKNIRALSHLWTVNDIVAGGTIDVGANLRAGGNIKATEDIVVGWGVTVGGTLEAGAFIRAQTSIQTKRAIFAKGGVIAPEILVDPDLDAMVFIAL